jgi:small subunit ribosomal protein S4e
MKERVRVKKMARLKRLTTPKFWRIAKKQSKWTVAPRAGPHKKFESIPIQIVLRDILKFVETGKEAETVLKKREVLVDGRVVTDHAFPLGLMDVLSIPKIKKFYRCTVTKDGLKLIEIEENESKVKLCRIKDKTTVREGKQQLNLHDGRNILVEAGKFSTGDSVLVEVPSQKITEHVKLEKGCAVLIVEGGHAGVIAKVKDVVVVKGKEPNKVVFEYEGKENETIADHVMVVGKTKPIITISGSE